MSEQWAVSFNQPPRPGTRIMIGSQVYESGDVEPHTRQDGQASWLIAWRTNCPTCDEPFTVRTPLMVRGLVRRCEAHRAAGSRVKAKASRRAAREVDQVRAREPAGLYCWDAAGKALADAARSSYVTDPRGWEDLARETVETARLRGLCAPGASRTD